MPFATACIDVGFANARAGQGGAFSPPVLPNRLTFASCKRHAQAGGINLKSSRPRRMPALVIGQHDVLACVNSMLWMEIVCASAVSLRVLGLRVRRTSREESAITVVIWRPSIDMVTGCPGRKPVAVDVVEVLAGMSVVARCGSARTRSRANSRR